MLVLNLDNGEPRSQYVLQLPQRVESQNDVVYSIASRALLSRDHRSSSSRYFKSFKYLIRSKKKDDGGTCHKNCLILR